MWPPRSMTPAQWRVQVEFSLLRLSVARGQWTEAHDAARAILEANGVPEDVRRRFGASDPHEAVTAFLRRSLANTRASAAAAYVPPTRYATLLALLGDGDGAIDWLETAASDRDPELATVLRDPEMQPLRDRPRFVTLQRRILRPPAAPAS